MGDGCNPIDAFLAKAESLGYDGVMIMAKRPHVSPLDYGAAERAHLRALLAKHNLDHNVLAGYCDLTTGLDRRDIPHKEIQLAYLKELSHGELAQQLKLPLGTVKTWIRRGLDHLRQCMARFA